MKCHSDTIRVLHDPIAILPCDADQASWRSVRRIFLLTLAFFILAATALAQETSPPTTTGQNIANGKPYAIYPRPTYRHCTDAGDAEQLTDGKTTSDYFWTQKGTVGWQRVPYATVTVDLGRIEPIGGVAMTTAAAPWRAGSSRSRISLRRTSM